MNKILVPTDFSETSENAVNYAIGLANYFSADLFLIHINQIPVSTPEFGLAVYSITDSKKDNLAALKIMADKIKQENPLISEVKYDAEIGDPADLILEYSKTKDIDLVVMGISGHGSKFQKNLIGSTSVSVSKKIEIPLIIVPPHVTYTAIKNIAYACDYDEHIEQSTTLLKVRHLNALFNGSLSILHVIPEDHLINEKEAEVDNYVERKLETADHRTFIITENKVKDGLIDFVKTHHVDAIIIEPKKHSFFHSLFYPSVTNELAFLSPVPVIVVHG